MADSASTVESIISNQSLTIEGILQTRNSFLSADPDITGIVKNLEMVDSASLSDDQKIEKKVVVLWLAGQFKAVIRELTGANLTELTRTLLAHSFLCSHEYKLSLETIEPIKSSSEAFVQYVLVDALAGLGETDELTKVAGALEGHGEKYARYAVARQAEVVHDFDKAIAMYEQLLEEDSEFYMAAFRLGGIYDMYNENQAAINMYLKTVPYGFTPVSSLVNLGLLLEDDEHYSKAMSCFQKAYDIDPSNDMIRLHLENSTGSQNMIFDEKKDQERKATEKILNVPVSDFELSVRSRNCLAKMNILTLGDLVNRTEEDLLSYKNFGETSLKEIKEMLNQRGLALKSSKDDKKGGLMDEISPIAQPVPVGPVQGTSIDSIQLSLRSRKCLERLGIRTLEEITKYSREDLMAIRNFGQTSFDEISALLAEHSLALKS